MKDIEFHLALLACLFADLPICGKNSESHREWMGWAVSVEVVRMADIAYISRSFNSFMIP